MGTAIFWNKYWDWDWHQNHGHPFQDLYQKDNNKQLYMDAVGGRQRVRTEEDQECREVDFVIGDLMRNQVNID